MIAGLCFVALSLAPQDASPPANVPPATTPAQSTPPAQSSPAEGGPKVSVEDEVLANVKGREIGPIHVAELALPEEFLKRVSDRVIRSSFEDRYRIVVPDPKPAEGGQKAVLGAPPAVPKGYATTGSLLIVAGAVVGAAFVLLGIILIRRRRAGAT